jgi:type IV pilus assembly protein PilV
VDAPFNVAEALVCTKPRGGFSFIEVLVAMLVLAAGVLGAAGAQLAALHTRVDSRLRSDSVRLAAALAERMRANALQTQGADAANPYLQLRYDAATDGPPPAPTPLCFAEASCDGAQMAAFDLYETALALQAGFPGGRVAVCRDAAGAGAALAWDCAGGAGAPIVIKLGWRQRGAGPSAPSIAIVAQGAV